MLTSSDTEKCCNFREPSLYIINKGREVTLDQENGPHKLQSSEAKHYGGLHTDLEILIVRSFFCARSSYKSETLFCDESKG